MDVDEVTSVIIGEAMALHRALGPGLLESVYQRLMLQALARRGLRVRFNRTIPFMYDGIHCETGLRVDLLVEDCVLVELKSVETLAGVRYRQVLTYLRLLDLRVGLLINFGGATLRAGLHRVVNNYQASR